MLQSPSNNSPLASLGWAVYLGMSWTWCIGMFLPVLLIRDYGVGAWWIFAVPNVIGAAAMGWVLRSPAQSHGLVESHGTACRWFSIVTLSFHAYFAITILENLFNGLGALVAFCVFIGFLFWIEVRATGTISTALVTAIISMIAFALAITARIESGPSASPSAPDSIRNLMTLLPVTTFGFVLCPYLDLTFHRARQNTPHPAGARVAFGVGFGVVFLTMMLFTLYYSTAMSSAASYQGDSPPWRSDLFGWMVIAHMVVQTGFTCAVHTNELRPRQVRSIGLALLLMIGIAVLARFWRVRDSLSVAETGYRIFMGFYGLLFPAYVWLCMIPGRGRAAPTRRQLAVFAIATIVAAPMFWVGFINGRLIWLIPGVGVVLLARLLTGRSATPGRHSPEADSSANHS